MQAIHFRGLVGSRILLAREIQGGLAVLCLPTESWEKCFWKNVVVDTLFIFSLSYVLRTELKRKKNRFFDLPTSKWSWVLRWPVRWLRY